MRTIALLLSLMLVSAIRADEPVCSPSDTPRLCLQKIAGARAVEAVQAAAALTNKGVNSIASPQRSTIKDFFTPLGALADVSTVNNNQKALTLNYNPIPGQLQVETTFVTPKVNDVVSNLIGEASTSGLQHELSNGDDAVIAVTFNRRTRQFGAAAASHRHLIGALLIESMSADPNLDRTFAESGGDPAAFETTGRAALVAAMTNIDAAVVPRLNNQPQLYGSAIYHHRKDVVGPSAPSLRLTWAIGTQNLNDFYANEGSDCGTACAAAFHRFVQRTPGAANAPRFTLAAEYKMREKTEVSATNPVALAAPHRIGYSIGYGRPFASLASGKEGRIDFALDYDGQKMTKAVTAKSGAIGAVTLASPLQIPVIDAPRDRIRAAGTFTQQLSDRVSVPVSLVWTDRVVAFAGRPLIVSPSLQQPAGLHERRLEVHFGIQYRITQPSPFAPPPSSCCCR